MKCPWRLVVFVLALPGCGRDFDALFDGDAAPREAATGLESGACDAGITAQSACTGCGGGSSSCVMGCESCGTCICGPFNCPSGAASCTASCGKGASCTIGCDSNACDLGCAGCRGAFTCTSQPNPCKVACTQGASCDVKCDSDDCSVQCTGGSQCTLACADRTKTCDIQCDGVKKICNDRLVTCNRDCPN